MPALRQIGEIRREERRPARVFEGTAQDYLLQLQGHLRAQGMAEHAALFASANPLPDRVQWFTDLTGEIRRLDDLPETQQREVAARVAAMVEDLGREAERLKADRNPSNRTLGEVLAVACEGPGTADIVLVGAQPVLAGWGLRPVDPAAQPKDLLAELRAVAAAPPAERPAVAAAPAAPSPPAAPAAPAPPRRWPARTAALAALLLALAAAMAWFLPGAVAGIMLALRLPEPAPCVVDGPPADTPLAGLQDEEARLRQQIAAAEGAVARRIVQCRIARAAAEPPPRPPPPRQAEAPPPAAPPPPREADETERRLAREGAQRGAVQVSLRWETTADLDLYVTCPTGATISYSNPRACGGHLDVDMNVGPRRVRDPIENITWPEGAAPNGTYRVMVSNLGEGIGRVAPVPFLVRIRVGERVQEVRGTASTPQPRQVATFTVP
ncbi:YfaP family protein [Elioraea sp.]|uniref:YfaP family protein n=1 Tax=Elioraea sp. TaxID=2185103 RepID=UPI003F716187